MDWVHHTIDSQPFINGWPQGVPGIPGDSSRNQTLNPQTLEKVTFSLSIPKRSLCITWYLYLVDFFIVNVGKYTIDGDDMGYVESCH